MMVTDSHRNYHPLQISNDPWTGSETGLFHRFTMRSAYMCTHYNLVAAETSSLPLHLCNGSPTIVFGRANAPWVTPVEPGRGILSCGQRNPALPLALTLHLGIVATPVVLMLEH